MQHTICVKAGTSIREAQMKAREYDSAVITVESGIYRETISLSSEDSGTTFIGHGAVLTGGISVAHTETKPIPADIRARLEPESADHIRMIDLTEYGYTADDWGEMYPIGRFNTANKYDDGKTGENLELFSGSRRMFPARYPNEGYLKLDGVLDCGDVREFPPHNYWKGWDEKRNPRGGTYIVDRETNKRMKKWSEYDTAWIFGYLYWDWADSSSPIRFDTEHRAIMPKYVSRYAARAGGDYYLYNVLEELDAPGEYYLDRKSGRLYVYPYAPEDTIEISLAEQPLISCIDAENITVEGFELKCTRNNGIVLRGKKCTLRDLFISNVSAHGIVIDGTDNTVENCEITRTGRGGIYISGGDREHLIPGNNKAINNYIHHFSEVYQTYQNGIDLSGVGNICAHNEISFSPHTAIGYAGNDHLIEYNFIHDVVLYSADASAIYSGRDWAGQGTVIRYNLIRDVDSETLHPHGIYWDDAQSGQTAYGNILLNIGCLGFLIGGGRDHIVRDNLIINPGKYAIAFDSRAYDGFFRDGWYRDAVRTENEGQWQSLLKLPYQSGIWAEKYPHLASVTTAFDTKDNPSFAVYPVGSVVENNITIQNTDEYFDIADKVYEYSRIGENPHYRTAEEANFDLHTLKFGTQPENFPEIPVHKIGRIKK